jgi:hypothetical protein
MERSSGSAFQQRSALPPLRIPSELRQLNQQRQREEIVGGALFPDIATAMVTST